MSTTVDVVPCKKKPWWKSKTLWTNAFVIADVVLGGPVSLLLSPPVVTVAASVVNAGLRVVTDSRLTNDREPE